MENEFFEIDQDVLRKYSGKEKNVTVPLGVRTIVTEAFCGCDEIEEITLERTVTVFNHAALGSMPNLKTVYFLCKDTMTMRTNIFYGSKSPITIVYAGESDTFLKSVAPYTINRNEYDPYTGRVYSENSTYYPLGHRFGDSVIYKVTCLGDGKSFTLKGTDGKPYF